MDMESFDGVLFFHDLKGNLGEKIVASPRPGDSSI